MIVISVTNLIKASEDAEFPTILKFLLEKCKRKQLFFPVFMNLETVIPAHLLWTHCQHLLWIGSDPLFTLLLFDWFGSKVIEGAGAILSCVCRSCTTAAFRIRELLRWNKLSSPHLRARSILLRAETLSGWVDKNPIQRIKNITLQEGHNIFLNLVPTEGTKVFSWPRLWWENERFVCGYTLHIQPQVPVHINLCFIFYGICKNKVNSKAGEGPKTNHL